MALRIPMKRVAATLKARNASPALNCIFKRYESTAPVTATIPSEGEAIKDSVSATPRDSSQDAVINTPEILVHHDPAANSTTAALVNEQAPYMVRTYNRAPPMFVKGELSYLWDLEGRRYIDFTGGIAVNALGHCNPEISKIISSQSKILMHTSNLYYNPWIGALSELLVKKTIESGGMHNAQTVFVCNSGTEANEAALKFARKSGKVLDPSGAKHEIVSFHNSFHGRTMGSLSATPNPKYQTPFAPMLPGFKYGTYNDVAGIKDLVTENTCGVIVEPIQGEGGVIEGTEEFLCALADRCHEVGAVLIYDEIQCGLSRTGTFWAHASLPKSAHPDIITTAKALGNGFPIGATIVNKEVSEKIVVGDHGTTFGGNPLGSRIAHYMVSQLSSPKLQASVKAREKQFKTAFETLKIRYPSLITEIRGRGLHLGLQLSQDPKPFVDAARERGVLIITAGHNTLRFVPSLNISKAAADRGLSILFRVFRVLTNDLKEGTEHLSRNDSKGGIPKEKLAKWLEDLDLPQDADTAIKETESTEPTEVEST